MKTVEYVFVILLYKNMGDVVEYLNNIPLFLSNYAVILVNSYYDVETQQRAEEIAREYNCDFVSVENRGYGYGNNEGIAFAKANYKFRFLIVSNSDVLIEQFDDTRICDMDNCIIGPCIKTISGKMQNPAWVQYNSFFEKVLYWGMKKDFVLLKYIAFAFFKFVRELKIILMKKNITEVYAVHGSFVMIHYNIIKQMDRVYDDNIFMFFEEISLAKKMCDGYFKSYYEPLIQIRHKEDGSVKMSDINVNRMMKEAFILYFENK